MKKFCWIHRDYKNESLNNLARRLVEYNTAELLVDNYSVFYSNSVVSDDFEFAEVGRIAVGSSADEKNFRYTVLDTPIINDIFNYNLYFINNTEERINLPDEHIGTFDCLVSLAAGDMIKNNPIDIKLKGNNHYIIDISPTAIHKSMNLYKEISNNFMLVDIFDENSLKAFLLTCQGKKGFFVASNCFCYIVNSLIYDVNLRLQLQNKFIKILAEDKIEWYLSIVTADGNRFRCIKAKDLMEKKLDERFGVLPWIKM
jgi:hypothetical protein